MNKEENKEMRRAHTAEHIFMRALYDVNRTVRALKVIHKDDINQVVVKADNLTWKEIIEASRTANKIIAEDRKVYIEFYDSFDDAKKKYPELRAYEERIHPPIRVVIIDNYDYAACTMHHVERTGECIFFLPTSLRKAKREKFEIDFLAGESAIEKILEYARIIDNLMLEIGTTEKTPIEVFKDMIEEKRKLNRRLRRISRTLFEYSPEIRSGEMAIKHIECEDADMDILGEITGKWIETHEKTVVLILNKTDKERYSLLLARSKDININLKDIGKELFHRFLGKGGGREDWIMGYIEKKRGLMEYLMDRLKE
jgi:alanyl-tRNA synthetase